jgi:3-hydroxyacyl-[acyl-carrier-protein] dehydratase
VTVAPPFGREAIEEIIPHRAPFLLIDEVVELRPGEGAVARKTVREDEWYLAGHFPGRPVMPGVLIVEALAQTGAVAVLAQEDNRGKLALFAGIDDCRFKRIVEPGDVLEQCGVSVEEVDLYVPHQANVRIMDHAAQKLGIPRERMVVNVDRYGNTSSGSIPLALVDAQEDGRLKEGDLVLMTGMGAGLTWGSALMRWTA